MNVSIHGFDYELRFRSLLDPGREYSFPCDASGRVDMDVLSERSRNNYLFARAIVGIELACPDVVSGGPMGAVAQHLASF